MNNILKMMEKHVVREAWNEVMDALVVEKLKEDYLDAIKWDAEEEVLISFRHLLKYYMVHTDFEEFMKEIDDGCTDSK